MEFNPNFKPGILEMFTGPMKSGKSLELIQRVERLKYMTGIDIAFFKPKIDTRDKNLVSRFSDNGYDCVFVSSSRDILDNLDDEKVVVIDEAQFFDEDLFDVVKYLLSEEYNVIVAGLDLDFRGEPFGPVPSLLALANEVKKLSGICDFKECNNPAYFTQRLINGDPARYDSPTILIGDSDHYETRCRKHHFVPR
ncbi:MAG: thymidine kinase [Candidatus Woesearchaeota archaeon]